MYATVALEEVLIQTAKLIGLAFLFFNFNSNKRVGSALSCGVFFRFHTRTKAAKWSLTAQLRNAVVLSDNFKQKS